MASDPNSADRSNLCTTHPAAGSIFRRRPKIYLRLRRRRLPIVRLGGAAVEKKQRRGLVLVRMLRRLKLKWLKLKYIQMMKKLKDYYHGLIKDIIEGAGTIDAFHQRLLLETSFAVPVMGLSFNSYSTSSNTASNMAF